MAYKIVISKRAENNLGNIFKYLESEWSGKVKNNFKSKLQQKVDLLKDNPFIYQESKFKKGVRRCIITKHNEMFYRIEMDNIEIITIQDTRKEPSSKQI